MAKGQRRSNREAKKPKKDKTRDGGSAAVVKDSSWLTVEKLQAREADAKRRR